MLPDLILYLSDNNVINSSKPRIINLLGLEKIEMHCIRMVKLKKFMVFNVPLFNTFGNHKRKKNYLQESIHLYYYYYMYN